MQGTGSKVIYIFDSCKIKTLKKLLGLMGIRRTTFVGFHVNFKMASYKTQGEGGSDSTDITRHIFKTQTKKKHFPKFSHIKIGFGPTKP